MGDGEPKEGEPKFGRSLTLQITCPLLNKNGRGEREREAWNRFAWPFCGVMGTPTGMARS